MPLSRFRLFAIAMALFLSSQAAFSEKPLTNDDVVTLSKLALGDDTIVAKIHQAATVDFKLETADLVKLKEAGVSGKVIAAMLDRTSGSGGPGGVNAPVGERSSPVRMVTPKATIGLTSLVGDPSSTYAYVTMLFWLNYPGQHATHRTADQSPSFLIASNQDLRSRYYIVRLDVNPKDDDRSVKVGKSGAFSFRASNAPDTDWTFPYESTEDTPGMWKVTLKKPLPPGEYGVFVVGTGELYDFGVE